MRVYTKNIIITKKTSLRAPRHVRFFCKNNVYMYNFINRILSAIPIVYSDLAYNYYIKFIY